MLIPNVYYDLQRSRYCAWLLSFFYVGACVVIILLTLLPWWSKVMINIFCLWHLQQMLYQYAWQKANTAIIRIGQDSTGNWWLLNQKQDLTKAELYGDSLVSRYLMILNFKSSDNQKKQSVLIFKDSFINEDFRRLQVRLKTNRSTPTQKHF